MALKGLGNVLANLNKEIAKIEGDVTKGLTIGLTITKGKSMKNTPVDTGNLKGSHYVVVSDGTVSQAASFDSRDKSGARVAAEHAGHIHDAVSLVKAQGFPMAEIGCTAFYAEKVHEDLEASHMKAAYQKGGKKSSKPAKFVPIGKPKFLEDAIIETKSMIKNLIIRYARR